MKQIVRAIVVHDDKLLLMHRNNFGKEYYNLVGGHVDPGETKEQALIREVKEETSLQVTNPRLVIVHTVPAYGTQYVYVCDYAGGQVALDPTSYEAQQHQGGQNLYQPMWVPLKEFTAVPFISPALRSALLRGFKQGWPPEPWEITGS